MTRRAWVVAIAALAVAFVGGAQAAGPASKDDDPTQRDGIQIHREPGSTPNAAAAPRQTDSVFEAMPVDMSPDAIFPAKNLHFTSVRTAKGNIVLVWGGVGLGDSVRFNAAMAAAKPVIEVQFFSPGGVLGEGIKIGRSIRSMGLATRVADGAWCLSACNFMFLGGVVRTVEPRGKFGVHMFSNDQAELLARDMETLPTSVDEFNDRYPKHQLKRYEVAKFIEQENAKNPSAGMNERNFFSRPDMRRTMIDERVRDIQQSSAEVAAVIALYLVEMKLSLRFLLEFSGQTSYGMAYLSAEQLRSYNVVTN